MLTRRQWLGTCARALLATPLLGCEPRTGTELGIILNTVAADVERAPLETLQGLAELGYDYVEAAGFGELLQAHRGELPLPVRILPVNAWELLENPSPQLDLARALGAEHMVCYWPWDDDAKNITHEKIDRAATRLNRVGKLLSKEGIKLSWHNHDKEFATVDGQTAMARMMEALDTELVGLQLDVYWARRGGGDPVALLQRYAGRIDTIHLKDMADDGSYTCPGRGKMDITGILSTARRTGVGLVSLEVDRIDDGMRCAEETARLFVQ